MGARLVQRYLDASGDVQTAAIVGTYMLRHLQVALVHRITAEWLAAKTATITASSAAPAAAAGATPAKAAATTGTAPLTPLQSVCLSLMQGTLQPSSHARVQEAVKMLLREDQQRQAVCAWR